MLLATCNQKAKGAYAPRHLRFDDHFPACATGLMSGAAGFAAERGDGALGFDGIVITSFGGVSLLI
jgi:hypothetical protein